MTIAEAKRLYISNGGPRDHSENEWKDIRQEMEEIIAAKTDYAAGRIIDWWGCWDRKYTATAWARRIRHQDQS